MESWAWQAMLHWRGHTSNGTQNRNRRMRNRMYGGVRGRKTKVGEKLLRFPPTRLCHYSAFIYYSAFSPIDLIYPAWGTQFWNLAFSTFCNKPLSRFDILEWILCDYHTELEYVLLEVLLVYGIVLEYGTIVIYSLWWIRQDAGNLGTFSNA